MFYIILSHNFDVFKLHTTERNTIVCKLTYQKKRFFLTCIANKTHLKTQQQQQQKCSIERTYLIKQLLLKHW